MIKVLDVEDQVPAIVGELPKGTVFTTHMGVAYILGKEVTSHMELPEALQNCRHRTALTGEHAGSQSMISNDALVTVCNCKLEITHEL
ncbi:hypothetical protein FROZEN_11 [Erwinia phage vB_EamP_Frozen]|uniref:Uncharacterized protein n=3 Tax=Johnsonvirus frozen TaxID=1982578 RepID=A0A191ZCX0_9CAUD|nr:hypothetical protein FROZEN_11 [Erwinia phage vB_EamP_Frozen]ANJ65143.1 hypothetical protein FROZEN_11 [Erwinia phage vB_EamP_Frozen]ANJ65240.1 hypothetical protein REXELLA_11 [Erwinia phage vB_EamP_Rexella]ANJ65327.1 hypothetical protein GUTMEISTER_11 [Erwinia phage vB_EamP_Gutmeister]